MTAHQLIALLMPLFAVAFIGLMVLQARFQDFKQWRQRTAHQAQAAAKSKAQS
jgi:hypothetical protein